MAAKVDTQKIDEDWQLNKSLAECNLHMLENGIATDVTFLVSDENAESEVETFSAHKYMLISRSPVFYTMLCGVLAKTGQIRVTDINPKAFRQMLNYIYTDDPELTFDLLLHVVNASKKYLLPGLASKCAEFIKDHQDIENVCRILDQILLFEENDLNDICLKLIIKETKQVLESEAFLSISRDTLSKILDIETSEVQEVDVFKACLKWAQNKCTEEKKEAIGTNIRAALGDCITKFRFSEAGDFARDVCPTGVLSNEEKYGMLCHLADRQAIPAPPGFNCEARLRPVYRVMTTWEMEKRVEVGKAYEKSYLHIQIYNNRNIDIKVNTLFCGEHSGYSLNIYRDHEGKDRVEANFKTTQDGNMIEFTCKPDKSPLIFKPGYSTLNFTYTRFRHNKNIDIGGVPSSTISLVDGDRIALKLSARDGLIPLLGIEYQINS